jgi:tRNA G18 (ribose-2'-O)-methylase SpoU
MPRVAIDDLHDPRIAVFHDLKRSNRTRDGALFVVEGTKLLERLRDSPFPLVAALVSDRWEGRVVLPDEVPRFVASHALVERLVGFNFHQGVLGCGRRCPWPGLGQIVAGRGPRAVLVCPNLTNPENLGALVRLADVFGVDAVLVGPHSPDPLSRRVLRVSMGTALRLPVVGSTELEAEVERLRDDLGFELLASVIDPSAEPLDRAARPERLALFLGNENAGLGPEWVARCSRCVTIPMRAGGESLNVAVAGGILLHHFMTRAR